MSTVHHVVSIAANFTTVLLHGVALLSAHMLIFLYRNEQNGIHWWSILVHATLTVITS